MLLFTSSIDDIYPSKKDSDSGVGSDNGDKRLSATEVSYLPFVSSSSPSTLILTVLSWVIMWKDFDLKTLQPYPWHEFYTKKWLKQR